MKLFRGIKELLTLSGAEKKKGRHCLQSDLGIIKDAAILVSQKKDSLGQIIWIGEERNFNNEVLVSGLISQADRIEEVDLQTQTVVPGLVECHTHSVFAGNRAEEFELKNHGMSYLEIANRGGGILKTMTDTRLAPLNQLRSQFQKRANHFLNQGVTTLESKSGYALNLDGEIKILNSMQSELIGDCENSFDSNGQAQPSLAIPSIVTTFLGAHALPPEFDSTTKYLQFLIDKVCPQIKLNQLSKRVDIFVENGFFEYEQALIYLKKAKQMGFDVMVHADQLSLSGGAQLAVEVGAKSADHLIKIDDKQIRNLAQSEVTCTLLPTADLYMKCDYPPARGLIDSGARVALSTDFNPGSSPTQDTQLVGLLARLEMKMTLPEVICSYTLGGAYALGLESKIGSLQKQKNADFLCSDGDWQEIFYSAGSRFSNKVFLNGALSC